MTALRTIDHVLRVWIVTHRLPVFDGVMWTLSVVGRGGLVCNLSVLGVYVTLDEPLPDRGERVRLAVQLPGQPPLLITSQVTISPSARLLLVSAGKVAPGTALPFTSHLQVGAGPP